MAERKFSLSSIFEHEAKIRKLAADIHEVNRIASREALEKDPANAKKALERIDNSQLLALKQIEEMAENGMLIFYPTEKISAEIIGRNFADLLSE